MKKLKKDEDQINALKLVANVLSLDEISRMTGVRLELLRRFINRTANDAKAETWDKVYPIIKPYLTGQEEVPPPKRIGPGYRRHAELVEMVSDQKVLLDAFAILPAEKNHTAGWNAPDGRKIVEKKFLQKEISTVQLLKTFRYYSYYTIIAILVYNSSTFVI